MLPFWIAQGLFSNVETRRTLRPDGFQFYCICFVRIFTVLAPKFTKTGHPELVELLDDWGNEIIQKQEPKARRDLETSLAIFYNTKLLLIHKQRQQNLKVDPVSLCSTLYFCYLAKIKFDCVAVFCFVPLSFVISRHSAQDDSLRWGRHNVGATIGRPPHTTNGFYLCSHPTNTIKIETRR